MHDFFAKTSTKDCYFAECVLHYYMCFWGVSPFNGQYKGKKLESMEVLCYDFFM